LLPQLLLVLQEEHTASNKHTIYNLPPDTFVHLFLLLLLPQLLLVVLLLLLQLKVGEVCGKGLWAHALGFTYYNKRWCGVVSHNKRWCGVVPNNNK
jgi:hypothetical protein